MRRVRKAAPRGNRSPVAVDDDVASQPGTTSPPQANSRSPRHRPLAKGVSPNQDALSDGTTGENDAAQDEIAAEAAAARIEAAEAERLKNLPPDRPPRADTPPAQPLHLPVLVFMWLRDRATVTGRDVLPSGDKNHVVVSADTTASLFKGHVLLSVVSGYLPRSDDQRYAKGLGSSVNAAVSAPLAPSSAVPTTTSAGAKTMHSALAAKQVSPTTAPRGRLPALDSGHAESLLASDVVTTTDCAIHRWPPGVYPALEERYGVWNLIRVCCRRLGLEMSGDLIREIADECEHDSLLAFVEGLYQCVRKADNLRREYSKSLVAEAAMPNATRAAEVHRAPPLSHTALVERKILKPVTLDGRHATRPLPASSMSHSTPTSEPRVAADEPPTPIITAEGDAADRTEERMVAADEPPFTTVGTQTNGRCVIVFDDVTEDPTYIPPRSNGSSADARPTEVDPLPEAGPPSETVGDATSANEPTSTSEVRDGSQTVDTDAPKRDETSTVVPTPMAQEVSACEDPSTPADTAMGHQSPSSPQAVAGTPKSKSKDKSKGSK
jgi:hypothetical protein